MMIGQDKGGINAVRADGRLILLVNASARENGKTGEVWMEQGK